MGVVAGPAQRQQPAAWTEAATYDAVGFALNCYTSPTPADSGAGGANDEEWRVVWDDGQGRTDSSNVLVGHSNDNLPPAPPQGLTVTFLPPSASARRAGTTAAGYNALRWTASPSPDVASLHVYREAWPGFTPGPANAVVMLAGNVVIYLFGLPWLAHSLGTGFEKTLELGLYPFVPGAIVKIYLAAAALPGAWRLVGRQFDE